MRIAIFSNTYLPTVSGVVRSISSYKAALEELGHEIHVFTQGARGYQDLEPHVHRYFSFHLGLPNNLPVTVPFSPSIDNYINYLQPDLIHAQHPILLGNVAKRKARQLGVPLVYTLHAQYWQYGIYMPFGFMRDPYSRYIARQVGRYLDACDQVIAPSESMRTLVEGKFMIRVPITVIPTGVDLKSFERLDRTEFRAQRGWANDFVVISTGRLAPEKNWGDLIQACSEVIHHIPDVKLVLLGDGPERDALTRQAGELGFADRMEFIGMVPYEEVPKYLAAADLFAFTSQTETQGLVTLEAMAAGLPVVAYDAIGSRDMVVSGENGILTGSRSHELAQAIIRVREDINLLNQLKQGAKRSARSMDIKVLVQDLVGVYKNSISKHQTR